MAFGLDFWRRAVVIGSMAPVICLVPAADGAEMKAHAEAGKNWDWEAERGAPVSKRSVYWIGHSLMEHKAPAGSGTVDLLGLVGSFAASRGLGYVEGDHTLWGATLSAMWRGRPHTFDRDAGMMVEKRRRFEESAGLWDTVVATEGIPVRGAISAEFGSYYLRRFYCAVKKVNPAARVYVYESYIHLHGSDPAGRYGPPQRFDWLAQMAAQTSAWEELADSAASGRVRSPGLLSRIGLSFDTNAGCDVRAPIFSVPVGRAMRHVAARLQAPKAGDEFVLPSGRRLEISDLFANPYVNWPADWPTQNALSDEDAGHIIRKLSLRDPTRPLDDIHPSAVGIYLTALVHFATLYRQTPIGLPALEEVGEPLARTLQCVAWETVLSTPRAGVKGELSCN